VSGTDSTIRHDTTTTTYVPVAIDILLDSSSTAPSSIALAPNSVDTGTTGPKPLLSASARYRPASVGVHSFVARVSGLTPEGPSFFTTGSNTQYLPRQFLTNTTYYSFGMAGINPVQPSGGIALVGQYDFGYSFPLIVDDPFTPPVVEPAGGAKYLQARFRVQHYATFSNLSGTGGDITVYLSAAGGAPADVGSLHALGGTSLHNATSYFNVKAGDYWLTITASDNLMVFSGPIHFDEGDVRTLFVQNAMTTYKSFTEVTTPLSGTEIDSDDINVPRDPQTTWQTPTFKITDVRDNQYTL
jgi:hypothetical protein